jgi:EAL domain-containing protein (putative c-di-GMP-specific phosphodiesterase class I)
MKYDVSLLYNTHQVGIYDYMRGRRAKYTLIVPDKFVVVTIDNDTLIVILADTYANNDRRLEKFLKEFLHPIALNKSTIYVHLKMGSYELRNVLNKDFDITDALTKTNIALARAASQVATSIVKYDSNLEVYVKYHEEMERDMNYALEHDEFVMYYQPQYSLKRKKIEGFESLIRWDNDKYRKVSPQEYIELAEKNGDIVEIGRLINRQVFRAAKSFEPYGVHLSINVSPAQLMQSGFVDELLTEFKKNALKPGAICVEITETFLMENYQLIISKLNILKANGFSLHLDDFGTGYSSMLYLKELPIDTIKTDKEFIKNLASDDASRSCGRRGSCTSHCISSRYALH